MTGFPFPHPILLVRVNLYETDFADVLEGTLVETVEAFDTEALRASYEAVMIAWTHYAAHDDSVMKEDTRRRLVDWINLNVCPRVASGRLPIWL